MTPGQLCSSLLHKFRFWPRLGKSTHVLQIARRKTLDVWKGRPQILRKAIDHFATPALIVLTGQNIATDLPVEQHQFTIDRD